MGRAATKPRVLELCAGGGGQALGLEIAGFECAASVEIEARFCETLRLNRPTWKVIQADLKGFDASDFGVPQLRPRFIIVAIEKSHAKHFVWPEPFVDKRTVAGALVDLMASNGWKHASRWSRQAEAVGPTLVGGSKLQGGPDLGPTRARRQWAELGVNGIGIAD